MLSMMNKQKNKFIIVSIIIGFIAFPSVVLGGTFVSSLIQGKTVEQATQILAEQIDFLIGRVEILETNQSKIELWQEKENVCNNARDYLSENMPTGYELHLKIIFEKENLINNIKNKLDIPECQNYEIYRQDELDNLISENMKNERGCKENIERDETINEIINEREEMYYIVNQQNIDNECSYNTKEQRKQNLENTQLELNNFLLIKEEYLLLKQKCDDLTS